MHPPLTKQQTAARIGVSLRTLSRMMHTRTTGDHGACPPWMRVSQRRVLFDIEDARRLLMGMVAVHSDRGGGQCVFEEAVWMTGGRTLTWQVIDELHAAGLMRFNEHGRHEMHPLFGSIAHRLFEFGHGADGDGGNVLTLLVSAQ